MDIFQFLLPLLGLFLGGYFAYRKKMKVRKREKLIDKCLEKYANEEKND